MLLTWSIIIYPVKSLQGVIRSNRPPKYDDIPTRARRKQLQRIHIESFGRLAKLQILADCSHSKI
jgi:hypothetical protein